MKKDLLSLREKIEEEAQYVDVKQYSHNLISINLRMIADTYGKVEANRAIEDFGLEDLGWSKQ